MRLACLLCALAFFIGATFTCSSCSLFRPNTDDNAAAQAEASTKPTVKKKILVLGFINRSAYGGEELAAKATTEARNAVLALSDCALLPETEAPPKDAFDGDDYNMREIEKWARAHGVAGILRGAIEDLQMTESGDEVGLLRARYHTVNATVRVELFDVATDRKIMSEQNSAEVMEERTEILDSRSPESIDAEQGHGAVSKALTRSLASLPAQMKQIAWVGHIAKVDLHRYYISAGDESGLEKNDTAIGAGLLSQLKIGQLLKVYGDGIPIVDPRTGSLLGTAKGRFKGLLKVVDYFGGSGIVATVHSGSGFHERDRVELFSPPLPE